MAVIEERSGRFRIYFRWHGKQLKLALGKVPAEEAARKAAQVSICGHRKSQNCWPMRKSTPPILGFSR